MPINRKKSKESIVGELIGKYKKTGEIGTSKPKNVKQAAKQAAAIAYKIKGESLLSTVTDMCKSFFGEAQVDEEAIQDQAIQYLQEMKKYVINAEKYIYTNSKDTNSDDLSSIGRDYYPIFDKIQRAILHDIPIMPENWKVINAKLPVDGNDAGYPICVKILTNIHNTFDFSSIPGMEDLITQTIDDFEFYGQD